MEEYLKFAIQIAYEAGKIMNEFFLKENKSEYKYDNTIVTVADKKINDYLINKVKEKYPTHSVYGEENSFNNNSKYVWVCDPIDGTAMYARQIPVAVFSLALVIDGKPIIGVVYDPFKDELYSAIKDKGAFKNNNKINVSNIKINDKRSVAQFDMWPAAEYNIYDTIKELSKQTYFVSIGSIVRASMCVASGEFTCAIFPGTIDKNYDIAAVKVIVEEAGGIVTNFFGDEQRYDEKIKGALISNKVCYSEIANAITKNIK